MLWQKDPIHGVRVYDVDPFGGGFEGKKGRKRIAIDVQRTTKDHRHVVFVVILPNSISVPDFLVRAETANGPDVKVRAVMAENVERAAGITLCGRLIEAPLAAIAEHAFDFAPIDDPLNGVRATAHYRASVTDVVFDLRRLVLTIVRG